MKLKEGFVLHTMAEETVVIPVGQDLDLNMMITLNETGKLLWQLLEQGAEQEELVNALLKEYEIDRETAEAHVTAFVQKLKEQGFVC